MIKHTEDFKREAVRIALSSGLSRQLRQAINTGIDVRICHHHFGLSHAGNHPVAAVARGVEHISRMFVQRGVGVVQSTAFDITDKIEIIHPISRHILWNSNGFHVFTLMSIQCAVHGAKREIMIG